MDAPPNRHGFKKGYHYSVPRFAQLLGMNETSAKFRNIARDMTELRNEHLNIDQCCATKQKPSLTIIEYKLKKQHPHIFEGQNGAKHLYFAMHVIMSYHSKNRSRMRQKSSVKQGATTNDKRTSVSSNTYHANLEEHLEIKEIIDLTADEPNAIIRIVKPDAPASPNSNSVSRLAKRVTRSSMRRVANAPAAATRVRFSEDHSTAMKPTDIHKFLSTCLPPMSHYLQCFVDFGCETSTYLRSVSCWSAEQRYKLLKKILESGARDAGVSPSEMDLAILEHQFDTYFSEN